MALSVIFGKPGAGKSYFAVTKIVSEIEDYTRAELVSGVEHKRKIYTNLPLKKDAINEYISKKIGRPVDAAKYIEILDENFFIEETTPGKFKKIDWWEKFPEGAYIVIDEVQFYLSNSKDSGDGAYLKDFQLYISTHRHRKHDLIFLTQHTDNINKVCLNMAQDAYHVVNIKGRVLPWLGIPFADFQVLLEAFGYKNQYANILYGNYLGRAFKPESTLHILLSPDIYKLYKSHNNDDGEDRPSLKLSRGRAVLWFLRRHFWHLFIKAALVVFVVHMIFGVICSLPVVLSDKLSKQIGAKQEKKSAAVAAAPATTSPAAPPVPVRSLSLPPAAAERASRPPVPAPVPAAKPRVKIITPDYVVIDGVRYKEGDNFNFGGQKYYVQKINFDRFSVDFGLRDESADGGSVARQDSDESRPRL